MGVLGTEGTFYGKDFCKGIHLRSTIHDNINNIRWNSEFDGCREKC